ncbi:MAG: dual specificity protein phosphatase family protein [Anaerolineales bacterium]
MRSAVKGTYWVEPGSLLAGPHPLAGFLFGGKPRLEELVSLGVDAFLDLTRPGEMGLTDYSNLLASLAQAHPREAAYYRYPIVDMSVPKPEDMRKTLDSLETLLGLGRRVYVHCLAGRGRTGTVIGCYLVGRGWSGGDALARIEELRADLESSGRSPETERQRQFVLRWDQIDPSRS